MTDRLQTNRLLRWPAVHDIVGISRFSARALELEGLFPKRVTLGGPRSVAWAEEEIVAWVQERLALRSDEQAEATAKARRTPVSKWRQIADSASVLGAPYR